MAEMLVVDQLILVAPAVQLADILAHHLAGVFACELAHRIEMNLSAS